MDVVNLLSSRNKGTHTKACEAFIKSLIREISGQTPIEALINTINHFMSLLNDLIEIEGGSILTKCD